MLKGPYTPDKDKSLNLPDSSRGTMKTASLSSLSPSHRARLSNWNPISAPTATWRSRITQAMKSVQLSICFGRPFLLLVLRRWLAGARHRVPPGQVQGSLAGPRSLAWSLQSPFRAEALHKLPPRRDRPKRKGALSTKRSWVPLFSP